ncbi:DUF4252 domain-containing protein [Maribacter sp. 2307ULW6-5]|uniref:DUF4252 domain-containing protein n=1 Tax=Maribacter sp. 2307ULW6-5 TaxID=3386275 RepID=UPI0039BD475E
MKTLNFLCMTLAAAWMWSCSSGPSLQQYYVDKAEDGHFVSLDIPTSMLNLDEVALSETEREVLASLKKMNVLAFRANDANREAFALEKEKVAAILKGKKYGELMKMNTPYGKATLRMVGEGDAIDELVVYGAHDEKGFVLVRLLGNDMNPAHLVQFIQLLSKSDVNLDQFEDFKEVFQD